MGLERKRKIASKQDKLVARQTGFSIQVNSGAVAGRKGDLYDDNMLLETKTIDCPRQQFTLHESWFDKLDAQAFSMGKPLSAIVFSFGKTQQYVACTSEQFFNLYKTVLDLTEEINRLDRKLSEKVKSDSKD